MARDARRLREDALAIWRAGVEAVRPEVLLPGLVSHDGSALLIDHLEVDLRGVDRIAVVGAGKAGASMALGLERALGEPLMRAKRLAGLVCVPQGNPAPTSRVRLVVGRPAGVNEPRPEGAHAADDALRLVASLGPRDLCLCLLSGGASALWPAPAARVTLDQKLAVTRLLSDAGATIVQLNAVRCALSRIKAGGLARACRAGRLVTLVVSDVPGDPLDVIGSGPTFAPAPGGADRALAVFNTLGLADDPAARGVVAWLDAQRRAAAPPAPSAVVDHVVVANNALAVDAAGVEAERRGYSHAMECARAPEGDADGVGRRLANAALDMRDHPGPDCLISGGEPVVRLVEPALRGRGGRNQQLALAALERLGGCDGVVLVAGGTDGEDGPTDAAGAVVDAGLARRVALSGASARAALERNDAYTFFQPLEGLLKTGATGTNVGDLRVVTVARREV